MTKLLAIETKSLKRSSGAKIDKTEYKYNDTSSMVKKIILIAKTNIKVYKSKIYKEAIINFIYFRQ